MNLLLEGQDLTLGAYFSTCSYSRAHLSDDTTLVLGPIMMPCSGTSRGYPWTVTSCAPADYYGWQFWLEDWASAQVCLLVMSGLPGRGWERDTRGATKLRGQAVWDLRPGSVQGLLLSHQRRTHVQCARSFFFMWAIEQGR